MREYKLLQAFSRADLIERINEHLNDGWELYGAPETERHMFATLYMQNMVLPDVEEHQRFKDEVQGALYRLVNSPSAQLGNLQLAIARAEKNRV